MGNFILVVDDTLENLNLIGNILRDNGYKIALAKDGKEALSIIESERPSLILLDIMMPEMDGYEVCKVIKSSPEISDIPVVFITAMNDTGNLVNGFEAGGTDYITKPFRPEELLARVKNQLFISEAKQIIQRQSEELFELNVTRDHLFSVISQDMRNPITSMLMMLQVVNQVNIAEKASFVKEALGIVEYSANETHLMVENLLYWSQLQLNNISFVPGYFDIVELIKTVVHNFKVIFSIKTLKVEYKVPEQCEVYADMQMLRVVIGNILHNAVKYSFIGKSIVFEVGNDGEKASIMIHDNGMGMNQKKLDAILHNHENVSYQKNKSESETGLGLLVSAKLLNLNNGNITIKSQPDLGTTVQILLPLEKKAQVRKRKSGVLISQ